MYISCSWLVTRQGRHDVWVVVGSVHGPPVACGVSCASAAAWWQAGARARLGTVMVCSYRSGKDSCAVWLGVHAGPVRARWCTGTPPCAHR